MGLFRLNVSTRWVNTARITSVWNSKMPLFASFSHSRRRISINVPILCTEQFLRDLLYNYNERHFIQTFGLAANVSENAMEFFDMLSSEHYCECKKEKMKSKGKNRTNRQSISREMLSEHWTCTNIHRSHMLPLNEHTNNHLEKAVKRKEPPPEKERFHISSSNSTSTSRTHQQLKVRAKNEFVVQKIGCVSKLNVNDGRIVGASIWTKWLDFPLSRAQFVQHVGHWKCKRLFSVWFCWLCLFRVCSLFSGMSGGENICRM